MNKKILLSSAIAMALGTSGTALAVDVDANDSQNNYAIEIDIDSDAGTILNTGDNDVLEARVEYGFSSSDGDSKYIRIDLGDLEFSQTFVASDADRANLDNASLSRSAGGTDGDNFIIIEVDADGVDDIEPEDEFTFNPEQLRTFSQNPTIRYRLYETATAALNADPSPLKDAQADYFGFAQGYEIACAAGTPDRINVVDPEEWLNDGTDPQTIGSVDVLANANVFDSDGEEIEIDRYFDDNAEIELTGFWDAFVDTNGDAVGAGAFGGEAFALSNGSVMFAGSDFAGAFAESGGGTTPAAGLDGAELVVEPNGDVEMEPSSYGFYIRPSGGEPIDVGEQSCTIGNTQYSGSTDRIDFTLTPGGAFSQFVRVTNPSGVDGNVTFTVYNDAGESVTVSMDDITIRVQGEDVDLPAGLPSNGSSPLININAIYNAAQAADGDFAIGSAQDGDKMRIEVRGEFGDDAVDGLENRSATDRRVDGIYIQGLTVATDGTAFFQTK